MKKQVIFLCLFFTTVTLFSQTDTLSIESQWESQEEIIANYYYKGQLKAALEQAESTLEWTEKQVGKDHLLYAKSLNNLGQTYNWNGKNQAAIEFLLESQRQLVDLVGVDDELYLDISNSLGMTYKDIGQYEKALPLLKNNVEKYTALYGDTEYSVSVALNNLALLYIDMRQYEAAIPIAERALTVTEKVVGKKHRRYPVRLAVLASIYKNLGRYEQAAAILEAALPEVINNQGKEHPAFTSVANNLVTVYSNLQRYAEAEQLMDEVLEQAEKVYGKAHRTYSIYLTNAADLQLAMGNTETGLIALNESILIDIANYEKSSFGYFTTAYRRPIYLEKLKQNAAMVADYEELTELMRVYMTDYFPYFNEKQQQRFLFTFNNFHAQLQSIILRHPDLSELAAVAYDQNLILKGALRNNYRNLMNSLRDNSDTELQQLATEWEALKITLSQQYNLRISKRVSQLDSLEQRANDLENQLARKANQSFKTNRKTVNWEQIQAALQADEVAIEFGHFNYKIDRTATDSTFYVAYVLTADDTKPQVIPLFEAKALSRLRATKALYNLTSTARQKSLNDLLWSPLANVLKGKKTIYFSPTGILHRINFGAIPIDATTTIADRYQLHQLGSTRQLLAAKTTNKTIRQAVVYGGIQYDTDTLSLTEVASATTMTNNEISASFRTYRGDNWEELSFTKQEAQNVQQKLQQLEVAVQLWSGEAATEERFKALALGEHSPELIHLATHGYFFPSTDTDAKIGAKATENPLVRSGLILAGANQTWQGGRLPVGREDGILTAYEIAQLDLSNTELVVLSACETGLGDIEGSEGVYGLQRALKIAGVKYILMSLWKVRDEQTQEFMTAFYQAWLENKQDIPAAFAQAQQTMRRKYALPFNPKMWAGFVLTQ